MCSQMCSQTVFRAASRPGRRAVALWGHLLAGLFLLFASLTGAKADIKITFDLKDGDHISDVTRIVAHVSSPNLITEVDFYVDGQERAKATSVPYEFLWDTIPDKEGPHTLKVTATDIDGNTASATLQLVIDNHLDEGATALAQKADQALTGGDLDTARRYSRRALKADPNNVLAARVLAKIYAQTGDYEKAEQLLAGLKNIDSSSEAMLDLASYRMRIALATGADEQHAVDEIRAALALQHKAADLTVEAVRANKTSTPLALGDALLNAGHYQEAVDTYKPLASGDKAPVEAVNRLALAYIYTEQYREASSLLKILEIEHRADAVSHAVAGLLLVRLHYPERALTLLKPDMDQPSAAELIVASWANLQLGNRREANDLAQKAASMLPESGDATYLLAMTSPDLGIADRASANALSLAPFQPGPYLDYGVRKALQLKEHLFNMGVDLCDLALQSDPKCPSAFILKALLLTELAQPQKAFIILSKLNADMPAAPDVLLAFSAYYLAQKNAAEAQRLFELATKTAPPTMNLQLPLDPLPTIELLFRRTGYDAVPFLNLATLYPPPPATAMP
ncbi:Tetratricopeptide repeat [Chthonomonas calidirosea]|uniref:tetratricopeptide repeat protein n=1 Tax=Chthonomonas calidirosea TaxID=454171 RepID=UPI0006DD5058|nr:tetratricopeptide repeat protein [Chthonomonas calidirosea]CEK19987.1 Tetratricopeptide repeat [Chthonomonas calidirosea]